MAKLTLYRQARVDGGVRTGIDIDDMSALEDYVDGSEEHDPALMWFVDLRCDGERLPTDPVTAWKWFEANSSFFRAVLVEVANHLGVGMDSEVLPYQKQVQGPEAGAAVVIAVSAARRVQARDVSHEIRSMADGWDAMLAALLSPSSLGHSR